MTDKDPKDMTAAELLREADSNPCSMCHLVMTEDESCATTGCASWAYRLADKIDAELAQARGEALRQGAELWAKANGWPDFREGEDFGQWLERCALKLPCDKDGEPWSIGNRVIPGNRSESTVTGYSFDGADWFLKYRWCGIDSYANEFATSCKRPAPEVLLGDGKPVSKGETVYVIESGIERTVKDFGTKLCKGMDGWDGSPWVMFDNGSWMHARDLTHERPVLGVDGKPIAVGDEVWLDEKHSRYAGSSGSEGGYEYSLCGIERQEMLTVEDAHHEVCGRDYIRVGICNAWCHSSWLTHTPPDTQQKIDEDAEKFHCVYFGGYSACGTCPASAGELSKKSCKQQQIFDLLRRQRELDKRTGGAE